MQYGSDLRLAADFGIRVYDRRRVNHAWNTVESAPNMRGSEEIENISSAEQASCPSTIATAATQPMFRRWRSIVTSMSIDRRE